MNKDKKTLKKYKLVSLCILLSVLIFSYIFLIVCNVVKLKDYDSKIYPSIYIGKLDFSGYSFDRARSKLGFYKDYILNEKVEINCNGKVYEYTYNDIGLDIDIEETINSVINYQKDLSYSKRIKLSNNVNNDKIELSFIFALDEEKAKGFLEKFDEKISIGAVDGHFDFSNGVKYVSGVDGFKLDVNRSLTNLKKFSLFTDDNNSKKIEFLGDVIKSNTNAAYNGVDTLVSSFTTEFDANIRQRATNLNVALNYINGAIVNPGEIFSYYKYAGPYNKKGYVFYYEFVGNGVCQIATTVYNAALLGGLEIVKRYPHAAKSVYVPGGLDATVASYSSGWNVDFQFKNTYKYPIYIKAYSVGGTAHVEFWSHKDAKEGKTYSTESVQIGKRGYKTYLHTYKDGVEIDKSFIATTWYSKD